MNDDRAMMALLKAGNEVRGGYMHWLRGAPTHVLAELLTALEADGWTLSRGQNEPTDEQVSEAVEALKRLDAECFLAAAEGRSGSEEVLARAALSASPGGSESSEALYAEAHAQIGDLRGMCTDEVPYPVIDTALSVLDDVLDRELRGASGGSEQAVRDDLERVLTAAGGGDFFVPELGETFRDFITREFGAGSPTEEVNQDGN